MYCGEWQHAELLLIKDIQIIWKFEIEIIIDHE